MSPQLLLRRAAGAHRQAHGHHHHRRLLSSASGAAHHGGGETRRAPQHGEESKAVKVSVWWDFENCQIPQSVNVCRVAQRVSAALRAAGVRGPLSITAFGDVVQLSRATQEALAATGVAISHVPSSGKNSSDRSFMADLVYWVAQNPPPAHFFLISGDKDFANILYRLRMSNYNILLACPSKATSVLCNAATIMWPWEALVKGEDFSPKRFNHPPDGLSGSWYGHYKGALDDPFVESESEKNIATSVPSDLKLCRKPKNAVNANGIPQYVVNGIQEALDPHPDGVLLSFLLEKLKKNNVPIHSDFFGHGKFSLLLQSMPDIVEVFGKPFELSVRKRLLKPAKQSLKLPSSAEIDAKDNNLDRAAHNDKQPPSFLSTSFSEQNCETSSSQSIVGDRSFKQTVYEIPAASAFSSSPQVVLPEDQQECPVVDMNVRTESPANHVESDASRTSSSLEVENTVNSDGLLKRIWVLWNGPETAKHEFSPCQEGTSAEVVDLRIPHQDQSTDQRRRLPARVHKTSSHDKSSDETNSSAAMSDNFSTLSDHDHSEKKHAEEPGTLESAPSILRNSKPCSGPASIPLCEAGGGPSKMSKGLFSWLTGWWTTEKSDVDSSITSKSVTDEANTDMTDESESLKASTCGSEQQVVNYIFTKFYFWDVLGKHLSKTLASELVSKAKTREELAHGLQKLECWPLNGLAEKDLNQLVHLLVSEKKWIEETPSNYFPFRITLPQKKTCVPPNSSKFDLSSLFSNGKPLEQGKHVCAKGRANRTLTREEVLSDCHKLLKDLLLEYKSGFNISIFKGQFAQKHGYDLDHKKLGYADIESLLQIMPGVTVKFPKVVRVENGNGQDGSKGGGNQCNGDDFIWEELGPVSGTTKAAEGVDKGTCYQPPNGSEDEFSDGNDNQADQQARTEKSSLLAIIDSWNSSSKDDDSSRKPQEIDGLVDCSRRSPGYLDTLNAARLPQKQYSFVSSDSEGEGGNKDKLVESVLGSLQKGRGKKLPS